MAVRVLLIDDDARLAELLGGYLAQHDVTTVHARDGQAGLRALGTGAFDAVLLDVMMPGGDGLEVLRKIRAGADRRVPVLMLTARGDEADRVLGLEVGADDYVVKPYSVRELLLRIRAMLRRTQRSETESQSLRFGSLRIDRGAHRCWVEEQEILLTALEFRLLATLATRRGRVQSRETLLSDVWGIEADVTTRTVDTHVKRLREKLGEAGSYIETLRGVGYRFKDSLEEETPA